MSYTYEYPRPAVATDCVVFGFDGRELQILLIERGNEPYKGYWAFPGGFMNMDESAEQCALRELQEETGLTINMLKQLGAFTDVHRDPRGRVVSIAFYALVRPTEVKGGDDASEARWFAIDDVPRLAFDHDYILRKAMQQMRKDIHFEPIGFELLNKSFTMSELQRLYEAILGVRFDRRNFEKKMLQTGILQIVEDEENDEELFEKLLHTPAYSTKFFGKRKEMQTKEIDELFGADSNKGKTPDSKTLFDPYWNSKSLSAPPAPTKPAFNFLPPEEFKICAEGSVEMPQPRKPGRKGRKFSFNKEKYEHLKQDNNFKLEF
ncbi:MAG: NUDIX hydrolase [Bacteroidales bacterium]|nr:NUDIX hydrolase [Bacteroidales bacterium]